MEVLQMTQYREILRLHQQGISGRGIAASLSYSRHTISDLLESMPPTQISKLFSKLRAAWTTAISTISGVVHLALEIRNKHEFGISQIDSPNPGCIARRCDKVRTSGRNGVRPNTNYALRLVKRGGCLEPKL